MPEELGKTVGESEEVQGSWRETRRRWVFSRLRLPEESRVQVARHFHTPARELEKTARSGPLDILMSIAMQIFYLLPCALTLVRS